MLTIGSLFSGIGGIELGLERTGGFKTIWHIEQNEYCQAVLRERFPGTTIYGDIRGLEELPYADVLCGGFPCQDISNAGKRAGIKGSRSGLWKEFIRVIRIVRPRYVIVENVAALLQRGIDTVLGDLSQSGYDSHYNIISASSVGAPHLRERVFIIGIRRSIWFANNEED